MKKNVKKEVDTEIQNLVYKSDNISLYRIDNLIHLFGYQDLTTNDILEILVWGIKNRMNDDAFWNVKLTTSDKQNAKSINIIYWLTGGDKIWKSHNWIWTKEWNELSLVFLEHFDDKIASLIRSAKTFGDLRDRIKNKLASDDFYELGISLDIINKDDILL